jgi:hypothetical protein
MFMPLASRILFTLIGVTTPIGAFLADYNETHIFNPNWPPHAKFHGGQTLSMSVVLGSMTVVFAGRKTRDQTSAVIAASGFAAAYYVSGCGNPVPWYCLLRSAIRHAEKLPARDRAPTLHRSRLFSPNWSC